MGPQKNILPHELYFGGRMGLKNTIKDRFLKTNLLHPSTPNFATNTQACVSSIQFSSEPKAEDINPIAQKIVEYIKLLLLEVVEATYLGGGNTQSILDSAHSQVRSLTIHQNI